MNKKKIILALAIAGAIGISYAIYTLKDLPEAFDWELDDE
jgi:hypothetical protein